jgi:hypothetical protein
MRQRCISIVLGDLAVSGLSLWRAKHILRSHSSQHTSEVTSAEQVTHVTVAKHTSEVTSAEQVTHVTVTKQSQMVLKLISIRSQTS